jgi:ubiquinol-cytochrome c reductase cytochrome c subunit
LSAADIAAGRAVFVKSCAMCHGPDGKGGQLGPQYKLHDVGDITNKLIKGALTPEEKMPPMGAMLSPDDLDLVARFVAAGLAQ